MPDMSLSAFVKFLDGWLEDPRVASYEGDNPLETVSVNLMKSGIDNALAVAKTILHLGDDDIYIAERAKKLKEQEEQEEEQDTVYHTDLPPLTDEPPKEE